MITYPVTPERLEHDPTHISYTGPWTDPNDNSWLWNSSKNKWSPVLILSFNSLSEIPTTVAGYGITDAGPAITFVGADPNVDAVMIEGITIPADSNPLYLSHFSDQFGRPNYASTMDGFGDWSLSWNGGNWFLMMLGGNDYMGVLVSTALSPDGLIIPNTGTGTGDATITLIPKPVGQYLGQLCRTTDVWWHWDGSLWN